jgi:hypothetical protein
VSLQTARLTPKPREERRRVADGGVTHPKLLRAIDENDIRFLCKSLLFSMPPGFGVTWIQRAASAGKKPCSRTCDTAVVHKYEHVLAWGKYY